MRGPPHRFWMAAAMALLASWPARSSAQVAVGVDTSAIKGSGWRDWGFGLDGRFGFRFGLPRGAILHSVIFQVEAIGGPMILHAWSDEPVTVARLGAGARVGWLLNRVEPFVYGHVSAATGPGGWGYLTDVGIAVDWRFPTSSLGLHTSYDWLSLGAGLPFWEIGPHVEVRGFWL